MVFSQNLELILREVEQHVSAAGWDQPVRLFGLVLTSELMASDPQLADQLKLSENLSLTSIEQEIDLAKT